MTNVEIEQIAQERASYEFELRLVFFSYFSSNYVFFFFRKNTADHLDEARVADKKCMYMKRKNRCYEINFRANKTKWRGEANAFRHIYTHSAVIEKAINRDENFRRAFLGDLSPDPGREFKFCRIFMDSTKDSMIHHQRMVTAHEKVDNLNSESLFSLADSIHRCALKVDEPDDEPLNNPHAM